MKIKSGKWFTIGFCIVLGVAMLGAFAILKKNRSQASRRPLQQSAVTANVVKIENIPTASVTLKADIQLTKKYSPKTLKNILAQLQKQEGVVQCFWVTQNNQISCEYKQQVISLKSIQKIIQKTGAQSKPVQTEGLKVLNYGVQFE